MERDPLETINRKNKSSPGMTLLLVLMLTFLALLVVLPPVLTGQRFKQEREENPAILSKQPSDWKSHPTDDNHKVVVNKNKRPGGHDVVTGNDKDKQMNLEDNKEGLAYPPEADLKNLLDALESKKNSAHMPASNKTVTDTDSVPPHDDQGGPVVKTKLGAIRGIYQNGVQVFHGIPYAKPPVGRLRWRDPHPVDSWDPEVFDATWIRPGCIQECLRAFCPSNGTSEDCLYLEIYVPHETSTSSSKSSYPVLVYIHGGSFQDMSATNAIFHASNFVKRTKVIVVFMEYRLGVFGFLVTGSRKVDATGNFGILDQRLALDWVRENIEDFGGDPEQITLAGHSAGAQSLVTHLLSDETSSKFRGAILQSLPVSLSFKTARDDAEMGISFARRLSCTPRSGTGINCLRKKSVEDIMQAAKNEVSSIDGYVGKYEPWTPVIDGKVVLASGVDGLLKYMDKHNRLDTLKPLIWGITEEEAVLMVYQMLTEKTSSLMYKLFLTILITQSNISEDIMDLYPATDESDTRRDLAKIVTDAFFRCPRLHILQHLSNTLNLTSPSKSSSAPSKSKHPPPTSAKDSHLWAYTWQRSASGDLPEDFASCSHHACHGVDLLYLFKNFANVNVTSTEEDINISNMFMDYISNFIRNSNPNVKDSNDGHSNGMPIWKSIRPNSNEETSIGELKFSNSVTEPVKFVQRNMDDKCKFWNETNFKLDFR